MFAWHSIMNRVQLMKRSPSSEPDRVPHLVNNLAIVFCNSRQQQPDTCPYPNPQVLLTPWSRVLLEKPTGSQLVMIFPAFHGTRLLKPATHPEPDQTIPCPPIPLPEDPS
jgi:hypothetical protein